MQSMIPTPPPSGDKIQPAASAPGKRAGDVHSSGLRHSEATEAVAGRRSAGSSSPAGAPALRARPPEAWPWWSVASILLLALIALAAAGGAIGFATRTPPPTVWPTAVLVTVTPQPGPVSVPVTDATPTPVPWSNLTRYVRVSGTEGLSLRIRSAPGLQAETIKLVPDGTLLLVTGDGQQADGLLWWPVRDPSDNKDGWAVSTYLIPDAGP